MWCSKRLVLALLALLGALPANAQAPARHTVSAGERARVVSGSWRRTEIAIGVVDTASADSIVLRLERSGERYAMASERLRRVDVSRGRGDVGGGAVIGALVGGLAGGAIGFAAGDDCDANAFICFDRSETIPVGLFFGAILGAGLGALTNMGERWEPAALPARATALRLLPTSRGIEVRWSWELGVGSQ
jgi:hypothetical protein